MNKMPEQISEVDAVINHLSEIHEDTTVPRNVRLQIQNAVGTLKEEAELLIKVNKVLNELDEIARDTNLQSYTRIQIWNVMSVLEKLQ